MGLILADLDPTERELQRIRAHAAHIGRLVETENGSPGVACELVRPGRPQELDDDEGETR